MQKADMYMEWEESEGCVCVWIHIQSNRREDTVVTIIP